MILSRRRFFLGASAALVAAPAIVRVAANLMPISTRVPLVQAGLDVSGWMDLAAITRRAYIPELIVQMYKATPVLNMLMNESKQSGFAAIDISQAKLITA